ncbi:MAG: ribonuclease HII [Leptospiraceae bacterium]
MKPIEFEPRERAFFGPVIGLDEAGRGCLAGPVSIGYTVFSPEFFHSSPPPDLALVRDSKRLSRNRREVLVEPIRKASLACGAVMASSRKIDSVGINPAIEDCMIQSVIRAMRIVKPAAVLVDGNYALKRLRNEFPDLAVHCIVGGDNLVFSIAAASILAKVLRDRRMERFDRYYPGYDFSQHAGYGTAIHRSKIHELGLSAVHRKSYRLKS